MKQLHFISGLLLMLALNVSAQTTINSQSQPLVLTHVTIIDLIKGIAKPDMTVIITGNKISSIGKSANVKPPKKAQVIYAGGKYLIPGLWDMHVHTLEEDWYKWQFPLFIANGIIGFREMWGHRQLADSIKAEIQRGTLPYLHFTASGHIVDGKKVFWPKSISAPSPEAALRIVDSLNNVKVDFVKIYSFLEPDVFEAIAKRCKEKNLAFAGHVPHRVWLTRASETGMASMEHLYGFLIEACSFPDSAMKMKKINADNFEAGMESKLRIEKAGSSEKFMLDNFSENRMRIIAKVLKRNSTYIVPTIVTNRGSYFANELSKINDERLKYMSQGTKDYWKEEVEKDLKRNGIEDRQLKRKRYELEKKVIRILAEENVPILAGTDSDNPFAFPAFSLHDELALFVEFGMTAVDALRTATINPVKYLKMTDSLGSVATGKRADIVLLNGNPLTDISQTKNIHAVILNGKLYSFGELQKLKDQVIKMNSPK